MTDKELASNKEECSQKDGRPYFIMPKAIDNHCPITVDAVLLPNKSEHTFWCSSFIKKYAFYVWRLTDKE